MERHAPTHAMPRRGESVATSVPAAATIAGDGVSPAASAAASGSPPGSAADTASADAGRCAGIAIEAAQDDALDRRDRAPARCVDGGVDASGLVLRDEIRERLRLERPPAREELVEHQAERVDVAPHRDLAARELLGRHVGRRAGADVLHVAHGRQAEVHDADLAGAVEHDVGRLQVAMQDAALVRRREARAELPRDLERLVLRQPADAAQQRREILAVHVLHRQEQLPVDLADVVDAADVGMRRPGARGPDFVVELREPGRDPAPGLGGRNFSATGCPSRRSSAR